MSSDLSGFSLFELFKDEARAHAATLSDGLLALEENPANLTHVEALMRAAHSLKGAARIIGLDAVVDLAHAMEDCFVAVQKGRERLTANRVDQLLQGVDVFQALAELNEDQLESWITANQPRCAQLTAAVEQPPAADQPAAAEQPAPAAATVEEEQVPVTRPPGDAADAGSRPEPPPADSAGGKPSPASPETAADKPAPSPATPAESSPARATSHVPPEAAAASATLPPGATAAVAAGAEREPAEPEARAVPVSSANLNRIMRLAGESMIEARQLQSMGTSLTALRHVHRQCGQLLEQLFQVPPATSRERGKCEQLRQLQRQVETSLQEQAQLLERALWRSERTSTALYHQVVNSRMRPFREGTTAFPRMIRDLSRSLNKKITFRLRGDAVAVDRDILRKLEAPLNHILRNCVDHGIEPPDVRKGRGKHESGEIILAARHHAGMLTIEVHDDGAGIDAAALRTRLIERNLVDAAMAAGLSNEELFEFLFLPGFSTAGTVTEISGRGVGLDVVRSMVQEVAGTVHVTSQLGVGTTFTLRLPVTLSVVRAALTEIAGEPYAFPLSKLVRIVRVTREEIAPVQGRQQFQLGDTSVGLIPAHEILELPAEPPGSDVLSVIVMGGDDQQFGLVVDRFTGEQDLVVMPLDARLGSVPHIAAAALTESGVPLLIADVDDLVQSARKELGEGRLKGMVSVPAHAEAGKMKVLVVDDSITVREVERQLLALHGYEVDVAVDGRDGWHALSRGDYDLLVTDLDMPRMNGIELIRAVRQDQRLNELPIVIVSYKEREEDRMRGYEAGANAFLTKGSFHDDSFIKTVDDLIGEANS